MPTQTEAQAVNRIGIDLDEQHRRRNLTLTVTNLIKLGGAIIVFYEIFAKSSPQPIAMAVAGFMMAGAQLSEDTIISLATKFFSTPAPPREEEKPPPRRQPQRKTSTTRTTKKSASQRSPRGRTK